MRTPRSTRPLRHGLAAVAVLVGLLAVLGIFDSSSCADERPSTGATVAVQSVAVQAVDTHTYGEHAGVSGAARAHCTGVVQALQAYVPAPRSDAGFLPTALPLAVSRRVAAGALWSPVMGADPACRWDHSGLRLLSLVGVFRT
jgi:hypothetical protein